MTDLEAVSECPLCLGETFSPRLKAGDWQLMECDNCSLVFTSPRYTQIRLDTLYSDEYYDVAKPYAEQQLLPPDGDQRALARRALSKLGADHINPKSLDVGCAGGRLVAAFSQVGFDAEGIEPSHEMVRQGSELGRNVRAVDLAELPSETYSVVTAMHVLEHVPDPLGFVSEVSRVLKPGGLCILEVPNFLSRASEAQGAAWQSLHPASHLIHFSPETLQRTLSECGFDVNRIRKLGGVGLIRSVSTSESGKTESVSLLSILWRYRLLLKKIPWLTAAWRWYNWEFLANGEYVQVWGVKPCA